MVIGAKEKLAANFTLFLGCFLAGLSTGSLLSSDSGVSVERQGGTGTAAEMPDELESEGRFSFFIGIGISIFSSWFKTIISVNTGKQTHSVLGPAKSVRFQFSSFLKKILPKCHTYAIIYLLALWPILYVT